MKSVFISVLIICASLSAASMRYQSPLAILNAKGTLALSDGSSYYVFSRDGTFRSFPRGMSGRLLHGAFKTEGSDVVRFTVMAIQSWRNGLSSLNDRRKIIFVVYPGQNKANKQASDEQPAPKQVWNGYYIIEELVKLPDAAK